jgi:hypothetical protein
VSWEDGIAIVGGTDVYSYETMAEAAPGLPSTVLGSAYTDRYLVHWAVGTLAALTGSGLPLAYRLGWAVSFAVIIIATYRCLRALRVTGWPMRLCLALVVLNPYALRYYAIAPAYLADAVFQAGLVVALLGMTTRRRALVLVGVLVAALARQTIVIVVPVLAVWLLLQSRRRSSDAAESGAAPSDVTPSGVAASRVTAVAVVVLPFALLAGVRMITAPFSETFTPRFPQDFILPLLADLPGSAVVLADHVLRVLAPLLLTVSIGVTALLICWRRRRPVPLAAVMCALAGAAVIGQPLGIGPAFPGFTGNQPRLSALGLIPVALAVGALLMALPPRRWSRWRELALGVVVVGASLHHLYTVVGPADVTQFIVLQGVACALIVVLLFTGERRPAAAGTSGR